jgi:hypothetical protein
MSVRQVERQVAAIRLGVTVTGDGGYAGVNLTDEEVIGVPINLYGMMGRRLELITHTLHQYQISMTYPPRFLFVVG